MTDKIRLNANAHIVAVDDEVVTFSGTVAEAAGVVVGSIVYGTGASTYSIYDGNVEANCDSIQGISAAITADTVSGTFHADGSLVTGLAGLTQDAEYYADPTTGLLGLIGAIASGEWTRLMGVARSTTTFKIGMGPVFQQP